MKRFLALLAIGLTTLATTGCVRSLAGDTYSREEAQRAITFQEGTLEGVRKVKLEGTKSGVGTVGGAAIGGIAGSGVGQGRGSAVAAVVGAVVGGVVGAASEEIYTREDAWELTIRTDGGKSIVVVQAIGDDKFAQGERVRIMQNAGKTRVTH